MTLAAIVAVLGVLGVLALTAGARRGRWQRVTRMSKVFRDVLKLGSWVIFLAAVVAVAGAMAVTVGPRMLGWQGVIVLTGSMEPALKVGGLALVEPVSDPSGVQVGDIITYRSLNDPNKRISHRVIEVIDDAEGLRFGTKGDNSELPDQQPIPADNVIGKVRLHVPYLGYAADKLRHRENFLLFMAPLAGLIILGEVANIVRELRTGRRKELTPTGHGDGA